MPQDQPSWNESAAASSVLDASNSTNHYARSTRGRQGGRGSRQVNDRRPAQVDYSFVQNMIEETVTKIMTSLNINARPNPVESHVISAPLRETPSPISSSLFVRKTADIMQKWNIQFDSSTDGLGVEEFIYRIKSLTDETLDSDFTSMCKHMHVLFKPFRLNHQRLSGESLVNVSLCSVNHR
ncbi:hypothetical protein ACLKA6_016364 [Drosophila palustris]